MMSTLPYLDRLIYFSRHSSLWPLGFVSHRIVSLPQDNLKKAFASASAVSPCVLYLQNLHALVPNQATEDPSTSGSDAFVSSASREENPTKKPILKPEG